MRFPLKLQCTTLESATMRLCSALPLSSLLLSAVLSAFCQAPQIFLLLATCLCVHECYLVCPVYQAYQKHFYTPNLKHCVTLSIMRRDVKNSAMGRSGLGLKTRFLCNGKALLLLFGSILAQKHFPCSSGSQPCSLLYSAIFEKCGNI